MLTIKIFKEAVEDRIPPFESELKKQPVTTLYRVNVDFEGNPESLGISTPSILVMKTGNNFVLDLQSIIRYRLRKDKKGKTKLVPTNGTSPELTVKSFSVVRGYLTIHEDQ